MSLICFTSFTFSYLAKARVLADSLRQAHPDWWIIALIVDRPPAGFAFDPKRDRFDQIVYADELDIPNFESWLFRHDVVEACTAVKGPMLAALIGKGAGKVIYLDPDIAVFHDLSAIGRLLDEWDILLTPHQIDPDASDEAVRDNEIGSLRHGVYNLGFLAVNGARPEARRFGAWWRDRLLAFCRDDIANGLFTDQRWCDLVPCLFDGVKVLRDPGYNVASWNLSRRRLDIGRDGAITVNGRPLRFYHFTKLGPVGEGMTARYAGDNLAVYEVWEWYKRALVQATDPTIDPAYWHYGTFADGTPVPRAARVLYRDRPDVRAVFPLPFRVGPGSYRDWLATEHPDAL